MNHSPLFFLLFFLTLHRDPNQQPILFFFKPVFFGLISSFLISLELAILKHMRSRLFLGAKVRVGIFGQEVCSSDLESSI